jgi:hypothetical protein
MGIVPILLTRRIDIRRERKQGGNKSGTVEPSWAAIRSYIVDCAELDSETRERLMSLGDGQQRNAVPNLHQSEH